MITHSSLTNDILSYIRDYPGSTGAQIREQFAPSGSGLKKDSISMLLSSLRRRGLIANLGKGGPHSIYYPTCLYCGKALNFGIPEPSKIAIKYKKHHPLSTKPRLYHIHSGNNACDCRAKLYPEEENV